MKLAALFSACLFLIRCTPIHYDALLPKAVEQYHRKDFLGAILDLRLLEQKHPSDSLFLLRAKCYKEIGKTALAESDLTQISPQSQSYPEASLLLGNIYVQSGDTLSAISHFKRIANEKGKFASEALIELGRLSYFSENNALAFDYFNQAVSKDSSYYLAYYFRGLIQSRFYNGKGIPTKEIQEYLNFNAAEHDYSNAILLNPEYDPAWFQRGVVRWNMFQDSSGLNDVNKAIELNPKDGAYLQGRASYYVIKKQYSQAIQDINHAIELNPYDPQSFRDRAHINQQLNKPKHLIDADMEAANRLQQKWDALSKQ